MGVGKEWWAEFETLFKWLGNRFEGREAIRAFFEVADKAFPNGAAERVLLIEEGNTVVSEWTWRGTNTGPVTAPDGTEIPATGRTVEHPGVSVSEVRDEKLAVLRDYFNNATVMSQLRLMPGT